MALKHLRPDKGGRKGSHLLLGLWFNSTPWHGRCQLQDWHISLHRCISTNSNNLGPKNEEKRRAEDRQDIVVSVLQASATRRDAQGYLRKYAPLTKTQDAEPGDQRSRSLPPSGWATKSPVRSISDAPQFIQGNRPNSTSSFDEPFNLAIVKLRLPQLLDSDALHGISKTLSQLRKLGLVSVIVLDGGADSSRSLYRQQAHRLQQALDVFGPPGAKVADQSFSPKSTHDHSFMPSSVVVQFPQVLIRALQNEEVVIIPPVMVSRDLGTTDAVDADDAIIALTKYFAGFQFIDQHDLEPQSGPSSGAAARIASIERIIVLDPLGGTPIEGPSGPCHRFINLEQEFEPIMKTLKTSDMPGASYPDQISSSNAIHAKNLNLSKRLLTMLPSTSSVLISTPSLAATKTVESLPTVTTRNRLNPLIHNLLTDKPVFSSSLPLERVRTEKSPGKGYSEAHVATVVKRGMPLTIFPDPTKELWLPPKPGASRLRLTDKCIDLPRLQHLIEDSFGRKLDLQHYLNRVNDNLAGIIIAGEYEGGAILTWEKPAGLDNKTAYETGRFVPYLDKFAVLRSRQGSGGVADVVFNAMVRGCFPDGVCWRSRKDNPVNKWYFERSLGTCKLNESNWTMFWTTSQLSLGDPKLQDYQDVCYRVEPSWEDKQRAAD
ncbi:acetylglutamate synthase [Verticillium dahliae VdLs.17]|uniref:Amino-acid acetyltransferase, mitochondrial n=1 Tax=Verticillium dahliae (strain VdLs.17 / ATCC MYA-4575 / FGSC 10137) TaxID=498257 RepID=G2XG50_VERDV|nr:acetylglutamate synthase [Verticillium dahliae VdLs.17]EGY18869.1 acetylglutamate synthase [Verticillium dahliae VdLs.17]